MSFGEALEPSILEIRMHYFHKPESGLLDQTWGYHLLPAANIDTVYFVSLQVYPATVSERTVIN